MDDSDPKHWDLALLLTGHDVYDPADYNSKTRKKVSNKRRK